MPSRKILFVLIISFGIVTSVYLFSKTPGKSFFPEQNTNKVSANPYVRIDNDENSNWEKILTTVDSSKNTTTVLKNDSSDTFEETTLTAQISRDFLSQYLLAIKNGPVTTAQSAQIAANTLAIPQYTTITGPRYVALNLNLALKSGSSVDLTYKNTLNSILRERSLQVKEDPMVIFKEAIATENESTLAKLDPIILTNKGLLTDLLNIEVPQKAVKVHLELVNATSNILSDLEALRVAFSDPIRSLTTISAYESHVFDFKKATQDIKTYFVQN